MASTTGTITSASSVVTLTLPNTNRSDDTRDTQAFIGISGSYTGVTGVIEVQLVSGGTWYPKHAMINGTGLVISGTITPGSNATTSWIVDIAGVYAVRFRATAWSTLTANVEIYSGKFHSGPNFQITPSQVLS
jgi:hypothetical protein